MMGEEKWLWGGELQETSRRLRVCGGCILSSGELESESLYPIRFPHFQSGYSWPPGRVGNEGQGLGNEGQGLKEVGLELLGSPRLEVRCCSCYTLLHSLPLHCWPGWVG